MQRDLRQEARSQASLLVEYAIALIRHWKAGITSGLLAALLASAAVVGIKIPIWAGWAFVAGIIVVVASFRSWSEEHTRRVLRVEVTGLALPGALVGTQPRLTVYARLTNADRLPRGVASKWRLEIWSSATELLTSLHGWQVGDQLRPLQPEEEFNIEIGFPADARVTMPNARLVLVGADIHGHEFEAELPGAARSAAR